MLTQLNRAATSTVVCFATLFFTDPAESFEVDADPQYSTEYKSGPNTFTLIFFDEEGPASDSEPTRDGRSGIPEQQGGGNGGPSQEEVHSAGMNQPIIQFAGPIIKVINEIFGGIFGGGGPTPAEREQAKALSMQRFIENEVPRIELQIDDAIKKSYGPNGNINIQRVRDEVAEKTGDGDCISNRPYSTFSGDQPMPSDGEYQAALESSLKNVILQLEQLSRDWNGDGKVVGYKESAWWREVNWTFDRNQFLSQRIGTMRAVDLSARKARFSELANGLLARAESFTDCSQVLSDGPSSNRDTEYTISDDGSNFRKDLRAIQKGLVNSRPDEPKAVAGKQVGLRAVRLADESYRAGNSTEAVAYREFALGMLDVATGLLPGVSWVRDLYEVTTGYDLITGRHLSLIERTGALIGVVSGGVGSKAIKMARAIDEGKAIGEISEVASKVFRKARETDHASVTLDDHALKRIADAARDLSVSVGDIRDRVDMALDEGPRFWDAKYKSLIFAEADLPKDEKVGRLAAVMIEAEVLKETAGPDNIRTVLRNFPADPTKVPWTVGKDVVPRYRPVSTD